VVLVAVLLAQVQSVQVQQTKVMQAELVTAVTAVAVAEQVQLVTHGTQEAIKVMAALALQHLFQDHQLITQAVAVVAHRQVQA
jgi:hypothetical protein